MPEPHRFSVQVYYEDTDAGGVVYHANYLRFAERARSRLLNDAGFSQVTLAADEGIVFVVRSATLDYRAPARLEDRLTIETRIAEMGGSRIVLVQDILRAADLLVRCTITLVTIDTAFRPVRVPEAIRALMARLPCAEG